jgi:hypothetical protein
MFGRTIALLILPVLPACSLCQMAPELTRETGIPIYVDPGGSRGI